MMASSSAASTTLDLFPSASTAGTHDEDDIVLSGQLGGGDSASGAPGIGAAPAFNTLDEPVSATILRDVRAVGNKFWHVLYPVEKKSLLREWDLWGPLILCTFMATILQGHGSSDATASGDGGPQFAEVFVLVWVGAAVVTVNSQLLGGTISFLQSVCVLGYCLLPLSVALLLCRLVLLASAQSVALFAIRGVAVLVGLGWASYASMQFLGDCQPQKRKALAAYPMFLFYFLIAWMVMSHSN